MAKSYTVTVPLFNWSATLPLALDWISECIKDDEIPLATGNSIRPERFTTTETPPVPGFQAFIVYVTVRIEASSPEDAHDLTLAMFERYFMAPGHINVRYGPKAWNFEVE